MKKIIAIVAFVAAMFVAGKAQAQMSVRFGYAPETTTSKYNALSPNGNYNGFFAGVFNTFDLKSGLNLTAGVQGRMNMKSKKDSYVNETVKDRQLLVEVPITLSYGLGFGKNVKVSPFVGPVVSFALSGKTTTEGLVNQSFDWYGDNSNFNRLNLSAMGGVNVKYVRLNLFAGYQMGLLDLNKSDNGTLKTSGYFVGLGYDL